MKTEQSGISAVIEENLKDGNVANRIIHLEEQIAKKRCFMKKQSKTDWDLVNKLTDKTIDYSDGPEVTEEFFKIMTVREPNKKSIHIRLDSKAIN